MTEKEIVKLYRAIYILGDQNSLKILFELEKSGEQTFSQLRDNIRINPASLSKKLKILTAVGLVAPDRSHDKLRVYYGLHDNQRLLKRVLDSIEKISLEL